MPINPISEYPEVTELTENDYLPVGTPTGLKRVKSSNVGGGGSITPDITIEGVATSTGSSGTQISDFTSLTVSTTKTIDDLTNKFKAFERLIVSGGIKAPGTLQPSFTALYGVEVGQIEFVPAEILQQQSMSDKDGLMISLIAYTLDESDKGFQPMWYGSYLVFESNGAVVFQVME